LTIFYNIEDITSIVLLDNSCTSTERFLFHGINYDVLLLLLKIAKNKGSVEDFFQSVIQIKSKKAYFYFASSDLETMWGTNLAAAWYLPKTSAQTEVRALCRGLD
jgi:hypothetical protein